MVQPRRHRHHADLVGVRNRYDAAQALDGTLQSLVLLVERFQWVIRP